MLKSVTTGATERQAGFTLIELSMVLVIIGLLVGGILQGQEMINNTRLKTTVAQMDTIRAGAISFEDKYSGLPGDFNNGAVLGGTSGDGDGIIGATTDDAAVALGVARTGGEGDNVWTHLSAAGLLSGVVDGEFATRITDGTFDLATFTFATGDDRIALRVRNETDTDATNAAGVMTSGDALSLDSKYDDGDAESGAWRAVGTDCVDTDGVFAASDEPVCIVVGAI